MLSQLPYARRVLVIPMVMILTFAFACGGSDDNDSNTPTPGSQGGSSSTAASQSNTSSNIPVDTAVVTVGTKKYEFSTDDIFGIDRCLTLFGVVAGNGEASDGSDVEINFDVPPVGYENQRGFEDYDPPSIEVEDKDTGQRWMAGGDLSWLGEPPSPGESQIDSYTTQGGAASGTATFMDINAYSDFVFRSGGGAERPEPVTGTFEVHCGD